MLVSRGVFVGTTSRDVAAVTSRDVGDAAPSASATTSAAFEPDLCLDSIPIVGFPSSSDLSRACVVARATSSAARSSSASSVSFATRSVSASPSSFTLAAAATSMPTKSSSRSCTSASLAATAAAVR